MFYIELNYYKIMNKRGFQVSLSTILKLLGFLALVFILYLAYKKIDIIFSQI